MPTISQKGNKMPESPIRKLVPYAEDAKKRGVSVFHLNIGQPDIKTPQIALDAVKNNTLETLAYARSEGSESYRAKLANYYVAHIFRLKQMILLLQQGALRPYFLPSGVLQIREMKL